MGRVDPRSALSRLTGPASIPALAYLILLSAVWCVGFPRGADTWGHLFKAEYLAEVISKAGPRAYFTAAWMPQWYMGDAFRTFYPPLTTLVLTPIAALTGTPAIAHKIFATLILAGFGALTFFGVRRIWGMWPAGLACTLAILAPYQLRTLFFEGNYPRALALLALPILLWATEKTLTADTRLMPYVCALAVGWAWAILSHPQQAYMFAIGFALYVTFRLFLEAEIDFRRAGYWAAGLVAGALLTAPWALPAYSHIELANVPFLPSEKVDLFAAPLTAVLPGLEMGSPAVRVGIAGLVLGLLGAVSRPEPRRMALVLSSLLTIWFSIGPSGVAFSMLPLNQQLLPERFLNFAVFGLAVSGGGLLPLHKRAVVARAIVIVGLILIDLIPMYPLLRNVPYPATESALATALEGGSREGNRTALFLYPEPRSQEVYFAAKAAPIINGWALENTPHHEALRRYLDSPGWAAGYLEGLMSRWGVDQIVLRSAEASLADTKTALQEAGFAMTGDDGSYQIFRDREPSSVLQVIPEERALLLGQKMGPFLAAFPTGEEATVDELSRLPPGSLDGYPLVGLYNFESSVQALSSQIERLEQFLQAGGVIVTDLSGMEDDFGRTLDFIGIQVTKLSFDGPMRVDWHGPLEALPESLPLEEARASGWTGATYRGLDQVLASVRYGDELLPIIGYKDVGPGRIWVIGLNLLYYAQQAGLDDLTVGLRTLVGADAKVWDEPRFASISVSNWMAHSTGLSFDYESPVRVPQALISYTYSPRLELRIDGQPAPIGVFEHLIRTSLPAGTHHLQIRYRPYSTLPPVLGLGAAGLGILALVGAWRVEKARFLPPMPGKAEPEPKTDREFAPCANCGFLMSEVGPPTGITYPFQVVHCPICGLSMDDDGFQPGDDLSMSEREDRLATWLDLHGYDPETVHERWGFLPDQFFGEIEGTLPPDLPPVTGEDGDGE